MSDTPAKSRRARPWLLGLGITIGLVGAIVLGAWLARVPIAKWVAFRYAEGQGFALTSLDIERLDFSGLVGRNLRVGHDQPIAAREIILRYSIADLRDGWVDEAVIRGLVVSLRLDDDGVTVAGLPPDERGEPAGLTAESLPLPPIRRLVIEDATIEAETPFGIVRTALSGEVGADPAGARTVAAEFTATGEQGGIAGRLAATAAPNGALDGTVTLTDGRLGFDRGTIEGLAGEVVFGGTLARLDRARASLAYASLDVATTAGGAPTTFAPGRIDLEMSDTHVIADADLAWPGGRTNVDVRVARGVDPVSARFDASGMVEVSALGERLPLDAAATGRLGFDLAGTVADVSRLQDLSTLPPRQWLSVGTLDGRIELGLADVSVASVAGAKSVTGSVRVLSNEDAALIELSEDLVVGDLVLGDALRGRFPEALQRALSRVDRLRLTETSGAPATLLLTIDAEGLATQSLAGIRLDTPGVNLSGDLNARVMIDGAAAIRAFEIDDLALRGTVTDVAGFSGDVVLALGGLAGTPQRFDGRLALDVSGGGRFGDLASVADSALRFDATLRRDGESLILRPTRGRARVGAATASEQFRLAGPAALALVENADHRLALDLSAGTVAYRLTLAPFAVDAAIDRGGDMASLDMAVAVDRLVLSRARPGADRIEATGATVTTSAYPIVIDSIGADLVRSTSGADLTVAGTLRHQAVPPFVNPVTVSLVGSLENGALRVSSDAVGAAGALKLSLTGDYHFEDDAGALALSLEPLHFAAGALQPEDILPAVGQRLERASGTLGAEGRVRWSKGTPDIELRVMLDALGFTLDGSRIDGLTSTILIDGIGPVTTPSGQRVSGNVTTAGLGSIPFEVLFELRPDGSIAIETARADVAGGQIATHDARLDPTSRTGAFALDVRSIDLDELTRLADLDGLSGEGRITGTIPLAISADGLAISDGVLAADGTGVLRVSGARLDELLGEREDTVGLMMRALADFHYEVLDIAVEKALDGEGVVRVHLAGSNPAVLDGYPFVFNINLTSNFDKLVAIMREGLASADQVLQWSIDRPAR